MASRLQQVDYSEFRQIVRSAAGQKISIRRKQTYLYDHNNDVLAILKPASIDPFGRTSPTQYFARQIA